MNVILRRFLLMLWSVPLMGAGIAAAQSYPVKPIRIIVPYAPGGSTDVVFRILAPRLTEILGQTVVVENRPGGSSTIGLDAEAAIPGFEAIEWNGVVVPAGTPTAVIERLH